MKDVVAVLGEWEHDDPVHIELAASGIEAAGLKEMEEAGLKAIMHALTHCPTLIAEREGAVRVEVGGDSDSFAMSVKIGPVSVNVVIRAEVLRIGDNANVVVYDHVGQKEPSPAPVGSREKRRPEGR